MRPEPWRVERVTRELHDTWTLTLTPEPNVRPSKFGPGQFNMLYAFGVGEIPISISGDPGQVDTLVHTVRAVGAVSRALCACARGDVLGVRGPYGQGWPTGQASGADVVVVAGGIGLAPLRPSIYELLAHRQQFGRLLVLYGTRTPDDILYRKELEKWRGRFDMDVEVTVDHAPSSWHGDVGVVTTLIPQATFDPENTVALVCGPEIMMRYAAIALQDRGVPTEQIYVSIERNMKCGVGLCGHCQVGRIFACKNGPVLTYAEAAPLLRVREL